jgi:hypothetical protein
MEIELCFAIQKLVMKIDIGMPEVSLPDTPLNTLLILHENEKSFTYNSHKLDLTKAVFLKQNNETHDEHQANRWNNVTTGNSHNKP